MTAGESNAGTRSEATMSPLCSEGYGRTRTDLVHLRPLNRFPCRSLQLTLSIRRPSRSPSAYRVPPPASIPFRAPPGKAVQPDHEHFPHSHPIAAQPIFLGTAYPDDEHQPPLINGNTTHILTLPAHLSTALQFTPSQLVSISCASPVFDSSRLWGLGSSRWYSRAAHAHSRLNFLRRPPLPRSLARAA